MLKPSLCAENAQRYIPLTSTNAQCAILVGCGIMASVSSTPTVLWG